MAEVVSLLHDHPLVFVVQVDHKVTQKRIADVSGQLLVAERSLALARRKGDDRVLDGPAGEFHGLELDASVGARASGARAHPLDAGQIEQSMLLCKRIVKPHSTCARIQIPHSPILAVDGHRKMETVVLGDRGIEDYPGALVFEVVGMVKRYQLVGVIDFGDHP